LHIADEEEDLFPLLRRRCPPEDEIDRVLVMLSGEHETDRDLAGLIKSGLEAALEDGKPISAYAGLHQTMTEFARNEGRHLALENSIVLPLARLRLTDHDLDLLSRHLIQRRQGQAPA
jgi:hemerythrin-like domain-containing protein